MAHEKKKKKNNGITTDKALLFSAVVLLLYTVASEVFIWFDKMPDSTLTACLFVAFGVAEGGYCTFIHHLKKKEGKPMDETDDGNLVIDLAENESEVTTDADGCTDNEDNSGCGIRDNRYSDYRLSYSLDQGKNR